MIDLFMLTTFTLKRAKKNRKKLNFLTFIILDGRGDLFSIFAESGVFIEKQ